MRRAAGGLLVVLTLTAAAAASSRLHAAQEVARWRWGNVCGGQVTVFNRPLVNYIALATWNRSSAGPSDCTITYTTRRHWAFWDLCSATVHEYGHLALGLGDAAHSSNPFSIMYPWTWRPYPPCGKDHKHLRLRGHPGGTRAGTR